MKPVVGLLVAIAAIVLLWLTYWGPTTSPPELPPLRPLVEPSYKTTPEPETTVIPSVPSGKGYVDDSTIDVREN